MAPTIPATKRSLDIRYAIRDVVLEAKKLEEEGENILKLNIGDPNQFDFVTPEIARAAYCRAIEDGHNHYSPSEGIAPLREAVVRKHESQNVTGLDPGDVIVGTGVTEMLQMIFGAALGPGDEILVPGPTYPPYITYSRFQGATPVSYRTDEASDWQPDVDDIRSKITPRTRALALISPNNPTGALCTPECLRDITDIVAENPGMFLISDEIYDEMTYERDFTSPAAVAPDIPVILLNGVSKVFLAPGWRLGYMAIRDPGGREEGALAEIRRGVENQSRARLCASTPAQYGYLAALEGKREHMADTLSRLKSRRDLCHQRINEMPGLSTRLPMGAFYMFPKIEVDFPGGDEAFVYDLLHKEKLLTVFGSGFCETYGKDHFRMVFLPNEETLTVAMDRLERYMISIS